MEVITTTIFDLLKYSIVKSVNTGDKTLDNAINAVVIAILVYLNKDVMLMLYDYYIYYRYVKNVDCVNIQSNKILKDYYSKYIPHNLQKITWYLNSTNSKFTQNLNTYFNYGISYENIQEKKRGEIGMSSSSLSFSLKSDTYTPLYVLNNNVIYITYNGRTTDLCYNNEKTLDLFVQYILDIDTDSSKKKTNRINPIYIVSEDDGRSSQEIILHKNRTLDFFVSKHKPMILQALNDFMETEKLQVSKFNGFGTYNLGLMLYGPPGTGKTSLIKGIANYVQKNIFYVNMTKLTTKRAFERIFKNYPPKHYMYVFEEFDCVKGVLSRTTDESKKHIEDSHTSYLKLKEEYIRLIGLMKDSENPVLKQEIENIKQKIEESENSLDLYTLLTTLDGIEERRGRLIIATTNHIERIDPALLREGRFDYKIELTKFNNQEIRELLTLMYKDDKSLDKLATTKFKEKVYTPVQIIHTCYVKQNLDDVIDVLKI